MARHPSGKVRNDKVYEMQQTVKQCELEMASRASSIFFFYILQFEAAKCATVSATWR